VTLVATERKPASLDRELAWYLVQHCRWYELALRRHGFTTERLMRLSRKVAADGTRRRGSALGDRFEDLVSRLQMVGLQAALRFDPEREHLSYGRNGGEPFASYVADVMDKRIDDHFRSKGEGFGDRRYGNDDRIVLAGDLSQRGGPATGTKRKVHTDHDSGTYDREGLRQPEFDSETDAKRLVQYELEVDPELDFEKLISEARLATWKQAADSVSMELQEYLVVTMDRASRQTLRTAA
jgi:hypothetical protein